MPGVRRLPKDDFFLKYYYDPKKIAANCNRFGTCKFVASALVKSKRFSKICPSIAYYYFDAYSQQGRLNLTLALLEGRLKYEDSPGMLDIFYKCLLCGACDATCKLWCNEAEGLRVMEDMRARLVQDGQLMPGHMAALEWLRKEDNLMMEPKDGRGRWVEGLDVRDLTRDKAEVCYHAGCRLSFDRELWPVARGAVTLLKDLGVDVGVMAKDETCCGGRLYEMGYRGEFTKYAENNLDAWKRAGVKTIITSCSDCWLAIKRRYADLGPGIEVVHMVEFVERLLREDRIRFTRNVPLTVTYHDPCHLGRRSDIYVPGKPIEGVFDPPRNIIKSIPGVKLVEMERIREWAWCCGSGCRVREDYPDFSAWTASERMEEAAASGAQALVTACPWCERNFMDSVKANGNRMQVLDIMQLVREAL